MLDIQAFHRRAVIRPQDRPFFVVSAPELSPNSSRHFFIDTCAPFGCRASESVAGSAANAIVDISMSLFSGLDVNKWVDDLAVFRRPLGKDPNGDFTYSCDRDSFLDALSPSGVPFHPIGEKGSHFGLSLDHLGFSWHIDAREVGLPIKKLLKYRDRFSSFYGKIRHDPVSLRDCLKILGTMTHLCFLFPSGKSRISALCRAISKFRGNDFTFHHVWQLVHSDIRWFVEHLSIDNPRRSLLPRGLLIDIDIFVDASTSWGIGILVDQKWCAWKLRDDRDLNDPENRINCLECWAVELLVHVFEDRDFHDIAITVHSDNTGVIYCWEKGRSGSVPMNLSIQRSASTLLSRNIIIDFQYIESACNPADRISRGDLIDCGDLLPYSHLLAPEMADFISKYEVLFSLLSIIIPFNLIF